MKQIKFPKWVQILKEIPLIKECYMQKLGHVLRITYSYTNIETRNLEKQGWISVEKVGRIAQLSVTEEGYKILKKIEIIEKELKEINEK